MVAAVIAACALPAAAAARPGQLSIPGAAAFSRAATIPEGTLPPAAARRLLARATSWGGSYTARTGESVKILVSGSYPEEPARAQRWADFLAGLVHGPELATVTVFLAPLAEVQGMCGSEEALACYSPSEAVLAVPGEDPAADTSAEAVVAHEYGHHVAASRTNAPWAAVDYGTKRWATYANVCARTTAGELFPGDEGFLHYMSNPGEGFAEAYRVLNQRRLGLPETPWGIVSSKLYPDDAALGLLEQDVVDPWRGAAPSTLTGSLTRSVRARRFTVPTPLDGSLVITLRAPAKSRTTVEVTSGAARLATATTTPSRRTAIARATVCGPRTVSIRVRAASGSGTFSLTVAKP